MHDLISLRVTFDSMVDRLYSFRFFGVEESTLSKAERKSEYTYA